MWTLKMDLQEYLKYQSKHVDKRRVSEMAHEYCHVFGLKQKHGIIKC